MQSRAGPAVYDVVVVGAGPVGSHAARLMALAGFSVLLVEEHPEVGRPVQCAGLVTPRTFDHTPFPPSAVHENDLHGGIVVSPNGTTIDFRTDAVQAIAMDRALFDQKMAQAATDAGVTLRTSCKAVAMSVHETDVKLTLQENGHQETVSCKFVIGADGIRSNVARWAALPPVDEIVSAYETEMSGANIDDATMIPMFAGDRQAPGFFSWIIPVGGDRVRAGLAVAPGMNEAAAKVYYEAMFIDPKSARYLHGATEVYPIIGGIPLGLRRRLVADRVAVVGDAAGMAKPTSGGGIHTGLVAAEHLAAILARRIPADKLSRGDLLVYERRVRSTIGKELRRGTWIRQLYKRFNDDDLNRLAAILSKPRAQHVIEKIGDIDYPSRLVLPLLLAAPRLAPLFARVLLRGAR